MKSMRPPLAAIFFMTYFHRGRGGHGPLAPPGSATAKLHRSEKEYCSTGNGNFVDKHIYIYIYIYVSLRLRVQNAVSAQPCVGKFRISLVLLNFLHCNFRLWFETT